MEFKVYIQNTANRKKGAWFDLPVSYDEVANKIGEDEEIEESEITDYECPISLAGYKDFEELSALVEEFEDLPKEYQDHAEQLIDEYFATFQNFVIDAKDLNFASDITTNDDLGHYLCDELEMYSIPSELSYYVDYEAIGRDYAINQNVILTDDGMFME